MDSDAFCQAASDLRTMAPTLRCFFKAAYGFKEAINILLDNTCDEASRIQRLDALLASITSRSIPQRHAANAKYKAVATENKDQARWFHGRDTRHLSTKVQEILMLHVHVLRSLVCVPSWNIIEEMVGFKKNTLQPRYKVWFERLSPQERQSLPGSDHEWELDYTLIDNELQGLDPSETKARGKLVPFGDHQYLANIDTKIKEHCEGEGKDLEESIATRENLMLHLASLGKQCGVRISSVATNWRPDADFLVPDHSKGAFEMLLKIRKDDLVCLDEDIQRAADKLSQFHSDIHEQVEQRLSAVAGTRSAAEAATPETKAPAAVAHKAVTLATDKKRKAETSETAAPRVTKPTRSGVRKSQRSHKKGSTYHR